MRRKKSGIPFKKVQKSVSTEFKVFIVFHRISSARFPCGREVCVQFFSAGFRMFPIGLSVFPPSFRKSPVRKCGNVRINLFRIDGGLCGSRVCRHQFARVKRARANEIGAILPYVYVRASCAYVRNIIMCLSPPAFHRGCIPPVGSAPFRCRFAHLRCRKSSEEGSGERRSGEESVPKSQ